LHGTLHSATKTHGVRAAARGFTKLSVKLRLADLKDIEVQFAVGQCSASVERLNVRAFLLMR
jgi:hypothetical protein